MKTWEHVPVHWQQGKCQFWPNCFVRLCVVSHPGPHNFRQLSPPSAVPFGHDAFVKTVLATAEYIHKLYIYGKMLCSREFLQCMVHDDATQNFACHIQPRSISLIHVMIGFEHVTVLCEIRGIQRLLTPRALTGPRSPPVPLTIHGNIRLKSLSNRACHPSSHCWDDYPHNPGVLFLTHVKWITKTHRFNQPVPDLYITYRGLITNTENQDNKPSHWVQWVVLNTCVIFSDRSNFTEFKWDVFEFIYSWHT